MNYKIIASKPVVNATNKNLKNAVSVINTRSNKVHSGYEFTNGRVDILQSAGFNMVWKTVVPATC